MLNAVRSVLILGTLVFGLQAKANDLYSVKKSSAVYGNLDKISKLDGIKINDLKCGYFLTKGTAYSVWGPSLTFFLEDSSGKRSVLYHMLNGTKDLDPIETIDIRTAAQKKLDAKKKTYVSIYNKKNGFLGQFIPAEKISLMIERSLNKINEFTSQIDTQTDINILRIAFKTDSLKKTEFKYISKVNLSCSFDNKQLAQF